MYFSTTSICTAYLCSKSGSEPQIHVMLKNYLGNKTQISITPSGTYKTTDGKISLNNTTTYTLKIEQAKLKLYKGSTFLYEADSLTFTPSNPDDYLTIDNRKYKGSFTFMMETINGSNYIRPVNTLGMEEYLKGVVPSEVPASWNIVALKAQAVAQEHILGIMAAKPLQIQSAIKYMVA